MSRADKTQTQITYDLFLDDTDQTIREVRVTVLCAARPAVGGGVAPAPTEGAFSTQEHVAFFTTYRFSQPGEVERLEVPAEVQKILR